MISADRIAKSPNWDGHSPHPRKPGVMVPNKDTKMSWPEHQRIVLAASRLLEQRPELGGALRYITIAFFELYTAFREPNRFEIVVTKGIHQPESNPHLQLVTRNRVSGAVNTFHLAVSAEDFLDAEVDRDPQLAHRFRWVGVQFTFIGQDQVYAWPIQAVATHKRERTQSIGPKELSHIRLARERVQAAIAARDRASQAQDRAEGFDAAVKAFASQYGIHPNVILCSNQAAALRNGKVAELKIPNQPNLRLQYSKLSRQIAAVPR